jgi:hypothetical protein
MKSSNTTSTAIAVLAVKPSRGFLAAIETLHKAGGPGKGYCQIDDGSNDLAGAISRFVF